jgi:hypothetical protein
MKIKLPIILLFVFFCNTNLVAQDTIFKRYNRNTDFPKFWIVGIDVAGFPSIKSNASEIDSLNYGESVLKWIESNAALYQSIAESPADYANISYVDYLKFSSEQTDLFENILTQFDPIIKIQKKRITQLEKAQLGVKKKAGEHTIPQLYLLNKVELLNWKKRLEI